MKAKIHGPHQLPHALQQPLHIHLYAARGDLDNGEGGVPGLGDVSHAEDVSIHGLEFRGEGVGGGRGQVGRESGAVGHGGGEQGEEGGDFVGGGGGGEGEGAEGGVPGVVGGVCGVEEVGVEEVGVD